MTILHIETSTKVCSAALTIGGVPIASLINRDEGNHARQLPLFVEQLLQQARDRRLSVEAVALSAGPGSYTGLRIGASTAKGLCYGLQVPLLPIPTTEVLCASLAARCADRIPQEAWLCPMIDARRMEVYTALYDQHLTVEEAIQAKVVEADCWAEVLAQRPVVFMGDGAAKCKEVISSPNAIFVDDIVPEAQYMGVLAEQLAADKAREKVDIAYFDPLYVKDFVPAPSHVKGLA